MATSETKVWLKKFSARARVKDGFWCVFAVVMALWPMRGLFSASKIFFMRDLALEFWPRHVWLRRTILSGQSPLWEPHIGFGQSAIADPMHQMLLLPTLVVRFLFPETVGFNLWIALPFPLAALGCYLFLRRHASRPASALGAIVYAISGPVLSTGNMPNLSWSTMFIPFVMWAVDRLAERREARRVAALALLFAGQMLAGEPVTLAATAALAVVYASIAARVEVEGWRARATLAALVIGAGFLGILLAAGQALPLMDAISRSARRAGLQTGYGTLHPLTLLETVLPNFFGDYMANGLSSENTPWILRLNDGRDPLFVSIYVGVGAVLLALFGIIMSARRRWSNFWSGAIFIAVLCALGQFTPFYKTLERIITPLRSFRYPVKYSVIAAFALAALVAVGWDALYRMTKRESDDEASETDEAPETIDEARRRSDETLLRGDEKPRLRFSRLPVIVAFSIACLALALAVFTIGTPHAASEAFTRMAQAFGLADPSKGAAMITNSIPLTALRVAVLAFAAGACLWLSQSIRPQRKIGPLLIFGMIALDLLMTNSALNPTMDVALLSAPVWTEATRAHAGERIYVEPKIMLLYNRAKKMTPIESRMPAEFSPLEANAALYSQVAHYPGAWNVNEGLSVDLAELWPREYAVMLNKFQNGEVDQQSRFLTRTGTRYYLTKTPPTDTAQPLAQMLYADDWKLYEGPMPAPRAALVQSATVEADTSRATARLFDADFDPSQEVIIERAEPTATGPQNVVRESNKASDEISATNQAHDTAVEIIENSPTLVKLRARVAAANSYLVLMDSYDPNWRVEVDGQPATLLRADGLFRAVGVAAGEHNVSFIYRPRPFIIGLIISAVTALALIVACFVRSRSKSQK